MTTTDRNTSIRARIAAQKGYASWEAYQEAGRIRRAAELAAVRATIAAEAAARRESQRVEEVEFYLCTMGRGWWTSTPAEQARIPAFVAANPGADLGSEITYHRRPDGRVVRVRQTPSL